MANDPRPATKLLRFITPPRRRLRMTRTLAQDKLRWRSRVLATVGEQRSMAAILDGEHEFSGAKLFPGTAAANEFFAGDRMTRKRSSHWTFRRESSRTATAIWLNGSGATGRRDRLVARRSKSGLADAQQGPKYPGLSQHIVPGYSQNLAANHVYRLDPLEQPPSGGVLRGPCITLSRRLADRWSDSIQLFA